MAQVLAADEVLRLRIEGQRLDLREQALLKTKSDAVPIVPGNVAASEIIARIFDTDEPMPPEKAHKPLTERQKALMKRWVEQGAVYEPHWAYAPLKRPALPTEAKQGNLIDAFVEAKLAEQTLTNFAAMVGSLRMVADQTRAVTERALVLENKAIGALDRMDALLATNVAPIQVAVSNVLRFSEQLNKVGTDLQDTVGSNRPAIQAAVRNLETASAQVTNLLGEVHSGRGLVGALIRDEALARNFKQLSADLPAISGHVNNTLSNVNSLAVDAHLVMTNLNSFLGDGRAFAGNGALLLSNLNAHGLFYKPKPPKPTNSPPPQPLLSPRQKSQTR